MIYVPHVPVMLNEVSKYLLNCKDGIYLDGTIGFGGHSLRILEYINNNIECNIDILSIDFNDINDSLPSDKALFPDIYAALPIIIITLPGIYLPKIDSPILSILWIICIE